jgi:hypothetical protein
LQFRVLRIDNYPGKQHGFSGEESLNTRNSFFVLLLCSLMVGCGGSGMVRPPQSDMVAVVYTEDFTPSTWSLPMGSVVPENSNLVLHRQPSKGVGLSMLFGPLGVIVANEGLKSGTREHVSALDSLRTMEVKKETEKILSEMRGNGEVTFTLLEGEEPPKNVQYVLKPFVLLEADRDSTAQISVLVLVKGTGDVGHWSGQYARHLPKTISLEDLARQDSSIDELQIRQQVLEALQICLKTMVLDLEGRLGGEGEEIEFIPRGVLVWNFIDKLKGRLINGSDERYYLVRTNYGTGVPFIYGLHVLDKEQIEIVPGG